MAIKAGFGEFNRADAERETRQLAHLEFISQFSVGMRGHLLEHHVYLEMTRRHEELRFFSVVLQESDLPISLVDRWILLRYRRATLAQSNPRSAASKAAYNAVAAYGMAAEIQRQIIGGDEVRLPVPMWAKDAEAAKAKVLKDLGARDDYDSSDDESVKEEPKVREQLKQPRPKWRPPVPPPKYSSSDDSSSDGGGGGGGGGAGAAAAASAAE